MRHLWPPIEVIASNLQTKSGVPLHFPDRDTLASETAVDDSNAAMPTFIRDKVRKRVATQAAQFDKQPKAGQVWRFDDTPENLAPLCVLLDAKNGENKWSGWLVASEADYATHQDVLLEPQDEPFDPIASMVQTWNKITIDISKDNRVLAQLTPQRLGAIREVASGQCEEGGNARPGFVAPLKTNSGTTVLVGTRIKHPEDPRHQYQHLYRTAAQTLAQKHGTAQSTATIIALPERQRFMRKVGWSIAASVMLVQAAIIANMMFGKAGDTQHLMYEQASQYRAAPQAPVSYAYLEVFFKPDAKEVEIRKLLTQLNASIVEGPGAFGQYRVKVKLGGEQEAMSQIKASGLVDSVAVHQ